MTALHSQNEQTLIELGRWKGFQQGIEQGISQGLNQGFQQGLERTRQLILRQAYKRYRIKTESLDSFQEKKIVHSLQMIEDPNRLVDVGEALIECETLDAFSDALETFLRAA